MKDNNKQPCVILAVNQPDEMGDRIAIHKGLGINKLNRVKSLEGCYKGLKERSYLIPLLDGNSLSNCVSFAKGHNRESILYLDNQRNAWLVFCADSYRQYLGTFKDVPKVVAEQSEAYTYDPSTNIYYVVVV